MDFSKFPVAFAYTIDCCELGEVVYETFNAGQCGSKNQRCKCTSYVGERGNGKSNSGCC